MQLRLVLLIAAGGAIGTTARYLVGGWIQPHQSSYPWGTLAVNVAGAFAVGFLMRFLLGTAEVPPEWRAALLYRPANVRPSEAELHRIEGLTPDGPGVD